MNEHVLAAYERAARIYCAKRDIDADTMLPDTSAPRMIVGAGQKLRPQWQFVAIELHDLSLRLLSLKEATRPDPEVH
jgi:hypothetical protein